MKIWNRFTQSKRTLKFASEHKVIDILSKLPKDEKLFLKRIKGNCYRGKCFLFFLCQSIKNCIMPSMIETKNSHKFYLGILVFPMGNNTVIAAKINWLYESSREAGQQHERKEYRLNNPSVSFDLISREERKNKERFKRETLSMRENYSIFYPSGGITCNRRWGCY